MTSPDIETLICQFLTVTRDPEISVLLEEVHYIEGNDCLNVSGSTPILIHDLRTSGEESVAAFSLPLSDDTQSDILGAFDLNPTEDTINR